MVRVKTIAVLGGITMAALAISLPALAAGNAAKGKGYFARCAICHSDAKGAPNRIGPNLFGIVGRKAGSMPGFFYSGAMKHTNFAWTPAKLEAYIGKPQSVVPGNRMAFAGVPDHQQVEDLIAYLKTLK